MIREYLSHAVFYFTGEKSSVSLSRVHQEEFKGSYNGADKTT